MQADALKLVAILPPASIADRVRQEQQYIALHFGPKHALRTPPHITLIPPLPVTPAETSLLSTLAEKISHRCKPFPLQLDGFGAFTPRVIYIHSHASPALEELHKLWRSELMLQMPHLLAKYPERPYYPHMTLAHRDVTPEQFRKIWAHYSEQKFHASFEVDRFWVLRHTQKGWDKDYMVLL